MARPPPSSHTNIPLVPLPGRRMGEGQDSQLKGHKLQVLNLHTLCPEVPKLESDEGYKITPPAKDLFIFSVLLHSINS